jgi:hypothetical protein
MKQLSGFADTWTMIFPADTTWVDRKSNRRSADDTADRARGSHRAVVSSPWILGRITPNEREGCRTYIAFPSCEQPVLVISQDTAVLRYLTESVLSTPPGIGGMSGLLMALGRRLLRRRRTWALAALLRNAGVVSVEQQ